MATLNLPAGNFIANADVSVSNQNTTASFVSVSCALGPGSSIAVGWAQESIDVESEEEGVIAVDWAGTLASNQTLTLMCTAATGVETLPSSAIPPGYLTAIEVGNLSG